MKQTYRYTTWLVMSALCIAALYEIIQRNWSDLFLVIQAIALSTAPFVLERRYGIYTPDVLRVSIVVFMFATLLLGEVNSFYTRYEWWDFILHIFAGAGLTLIGFLLLLVIYRESELRSTAYMTTLLAFSITMMAAVLWEVYEFGIDTFFRTDDHMQPSNTDTMTDLIASILGGLLISISGYRYLRYRKKDIVSRVIRDGATGNS